MVSLLFVAVVRLIDLVARARFPPYHPSPPDVGAVDAFWAFWDGSTEVLSLRASVTVVSLMLVLLLWLRCRGLMLAGRRGLLTWVPYLGAALLLAHLHVAIARISRIEPDYVFIPISDDQFVREYFSGGDRE